MITNAELVPTQPKTFAELSATVEKLRKKGKVKRGFMVPQGAGSDGSAMYTLFSGLGGYFFKTDSAGALDPANIGLASAPLLKNSSIIDGWNATKLINSDITAEVARSTFERGKAAFWMAGPEDMDTLKSLKFVYRITPVPTIVGKRTPAPLLRIQGFMVTKFAAKHGVADAAQKLVTRFMATVGRQLALAAASGLNPASTVAAKQVAERRLTAIAAAAAEGVPVPNIPQMNSVWAPYGGAWAAATSGLGATPAKDAFTAAQAAVVAALG
jgi:arabinogalactan oligomer/maltooligosaccharide transport system substrate-binding protein